MVLSAGMVSLPRSSASWCSVQAWSPWLRPWWYALPLLPLPAPPTHAHIIEGSLGVVVPSWLHACVGCVCDAQPFYLCRGYVPHVDWLLVPKVVATLGVMEVGFTLAHRKLHSTWASLHHCCRKTSL
jgi:hypothetical protein